MQTRKTTYLDNFHAVPGTLNPSNLGNAFSEKLTSIVKKDWSYEQKKLTASKSYIKNCLSHKTVVKDLPLS